MKNTSLAQTLTNQDGVISLQQAFSCGLSDAAVRWKLASGAWRRISSGIFHATDFRFSPSARLHGALLAAGDGAVVFGPSAAWCHGFLPSAPLIPWITIPSARLIRRKESLIVRRRNLDRRDVTRVRGIDVTTPELTVLETAVEIPEGSAFLDQMLLKRVALGDLIDVHERNVGRRGSTASKRLLTSATTGGLEEARRLLIKTITQAELPGWEESVAVGGHAFDAGFPVERIGIEVDGWASHPLSRGTRIDSRRHNMLIAAGWSILRFDWHRLDGDSAGVLAEIRSVLTTRQRRVGVR
jgi:very-short-patch-repair endonuclease